MIYIIHFFYINSVPVKLNESKDTKFIYKYKFITKISILRNIVYILNRLKLHYNEIILGQIELNMKALFIPITLFLLVTAISTTYSQTTSFLKSDIPPDTSLCEGFTSPSFPPAGWSLEYSGNLYWTRDIRSSYDSGVGCARFNFYEAITIQSLVTKTFTPTLLLDTLSIDFSYQPFPSAPDSLIIETSANGGTNYISYKRLGVDDFQTFFNSWITRKYGGLPIGTNKIKFKAKSGGGNFLYIDRICIIKNYVGILPNININPASFYLSQNYPNPFNPSTEIIYYIPAESYIELILYDANGKEVKILDEGIKKTGAYKNEINGIGLSSGIYFYTLTADKYIETRKMVLIK